MKVRKMASRHDRPTDIGENRVCGVCGKEKPRDAEHFKPSKGCRGGITGTCRACFAAYHREWKAKNKERLAPIRRAQYAESGKVVEARLARQRWKNDPCRQRAISMARGIRERSASSGMPLDRDIFTVKALAEWLRRQQSCECCGIQFSPKGGVGTNRRVNALPSIDQLVPGAGYTAGNVALICWRCNNLKRDATAGELERIAAWMRRRGGGAKPIQLHFDVLDS